MKISKGSFTGVGLGPGDPELITVKGYKALLAADIIYYPVTLLKEGKEQSFSSRIISGLNIKKECQPLLIPMKGIDTEKFYHQAFKIIKEEVENGKNVVLVSEGDLLFYSTFGYIYKIACNLGIECHLIPGLPAFIAAGSLGKSPLAEKDGSITVMAKPKSFGEINEALNHQSTLVIMKIKVLEGWYSFLKDCKRSFLYAEKVGTGDEFHTSDVRDLEFRKIPYFSILIIYPED